jgi:hypothetical protein
LVVVGIALLIIGAGVISAVGLLPNAEKASQTWPVVARDISYNATVNRTFPVATSGGASEQFELTWSSTGPVAVSVYNATDCGSATGICTAGFPVRNWYSNTNGTWTAPSPLPEYYMVKVWGNSLAPVNFTGHATETYSAPWSPLPTWATLSLVVGGVVLLAIGGIALFLGFFLRPAVYSPPGEPPLYPPFDPYEVDETDEFDEDDLTEPPGASDPPEP